MIWTVSQWPAYHGSCGGHEHTLLSKTEDTLQVGQLDVCTRCVGVSQHLRRASAHHQVSSCDHHPLVLVVNVDWWK